MQQLCRLHQRGRAALSGLRYEKVKMRFSPLGRALSDPRMSEKKRTHARSRLTKGHVRQHAEIAKYTPDAPRVSRGPLGASHSAGSGTKVTGVITHLR